VPCPQKRMNKQSLKNPTVAGSTDANLIEKLYILFTSPNYNRNLEKTEWATNTKSC
jgi:hypothetical protein